MALKTGTDGNSMAAAFSNAQQQAPNQPQQQQAPARGGFSFRNMGGLTHTAMGRTPASEVLSKLNKALVEVYTEAADSKTFEFTLIPIDLNSTTELSVSVLVLAVRLRDMPDVGVAYHTLIIEGSVDQPQPRFEMINGTNVEIIRTLGEANDPVLRQVVSTYVSRHFPQSRQLYVDACVIPRDFNVTDTQAVYRLAANAMFATSSELEIHQPGFVDLNLANAERDSNLTIRTTFGNPETSNAVGNPIRSDVEIVFSAAPLNAQQNSQQAVERVSHIARISGFVDLVWAPQEMQAYAPYMQPPQVQRDYRQYVARFVVTALESTQLLTIGAQLLALNMALSLREGDKWAQAFARQGFSNDIDLHDIGAVGIEVNFEGNPNGIGSRIDTKSDSFKPEHYHKLIGSTVRQGMALSLDVPECGPDTWYNGVFGAAASGNAAAKQAIVDAANALTNGAFANYFPVGSEIASDEANRIHLGSYVDSSGVRKDIREIDYLAIMNMVGEKDPAAIRDWSDTFLKANYPIELRLAGRKRIISALFSNVQFTGYATRVTFTTAFTDALVRGCLAAGLTVRPVDSYADMASYDRATSNYIGQAVMSGDLSGMFNRGGFGGNPNQNYGNSRFVGRW